MAETQVGRRFRVGLVVLVALFAVMIGVFMVGKRANLFRKKLPYETRFDSAEGVVPGNPVRLNGVTVGSVLEVILTPDPADRTVRVVYDVDRRAAPRLRKGTRASIKTIGLLGDKYIDLAGGTAEEPEVEIGGTDSRGARRGHREAARGRRRPGHGSRRRSPGRSRTSSAAPSRARASSAR